MAKGAKKQIKKAKVQSESEAEESRSNFLEDEALESDSQFEDPEPKVVKKVKTEKCSCEPPVWGEQEFTVTLDDQCFSFGKRQDKDSYSFVPVNYQFPTKAKPIQVGIIFAKKAKKAVSTKKPTTIEELEAENQKVEWTYSEGTYLIPNLECVPIYLKHLKYDEWVAQATKKKN